MPHPRSPRQWCEETGTGRRVDIGTVGDKKFHNKIANLSGYTEVGAVSDKGDAGITF